MTINATDLDPGSAYNLFIDSIIPRPIDWVTTLSVHLHQWIEVARPA
jgi:hypothetical protein